MIIIAERINATRQAIKAALLAKDEALLKQEAKAQAEAGADWLDLNAAAEPEREVELMEWLAETVQAEVKTPLCLDSANPRAIAAGLKLHRNGKAMVNSITMETGRHEAVLPLVKEYGAAVIGLAMGDGGIGKSAAERLRVVEKMAEAAARHGIPLADVYVDPLVLTISSEAQSGLIALEVVRGIKSHWPELRTTAGLSNISFGLPERKLLNRTFLAMLLAAGLDSALVDPLDRQLMAVITASSALLAQDPYCRNYLKAFRAGNLAD